MVTGKRLGHPVRSLRTAFAGTTAGPNTAPCPMPSWSSSASARCAKPVQDGNLEEGCFLSAARSRPWCTKVEPAADIVRSVVEESRTHPERSREMGKIAFVFSVRARSIPAWAANLLTVPRRTCSVRSSGCPPSRHVGAVLLRLDGRALRDEEHAALHVRRRAGGAAALREAGIRADMAAGFSPWRAGRADLRRRNGF